MIANTYVSDAEHTRIMLFFIITSVTMLVAIPVAEHYRMKLRHHKMRNHPSMRNRKDK